MKRNDLSLLKRRRLNERSLSFNEILHLDDFHWRKTAEAPFV